MASRWSDDATRRTVLKTVGAGIAALTLAGCSGGSDGGSTGGGSNDGGGDGDSGGDTATKPPEDTSGSGDGGSSDGGYGDFLSDVDYDGSPTDKTGSSEVTVVVGAEGNGGNFAFDPVVVKVSKGTTVVWEWNGKGGSHNVFAENGDFESEIVAEEGHTFSHTFESAGAVKYSCEPHKSLGMKGVVVVE